MENFFSLVRANGFRDNKPTCYQFNGTFKPLLIDNFTSPHSIGANCAPDGSRFLVSWADYREEIQHIEPDYSITQGPVNRHFSNDLNYACSFQSFCKEVKANIPKCEQCAEFLTDERAIKNIFSKCLFIFSVALYNFLML